MLNLLGPTMTTCYPPWRKFRRALTKQTVELLLEAEKNGYSVTVVDGNIRNHQQLICPRADQPFVIGFRDTDGRRHESMRIALHPNGLTIEYADETESARPRYPVFTIGNEAESYHPQLSEQYETMTGESLKNDARQWLAHRNLVVFVFSAAGGLVVGEFVAPVEMAHAVQQFAMIHRVDTYRQLATRKTSVNTTYWVAPGLRHTLFSGNQNVTFYPEDDGRMFVVGNSVYDGMLAKKPIFNIIAWRAWLRGGMANHASLATPMARGRFLERHFQGLEDYATSIFCDSGRGKTELRKMLEHYLLNGHLLLGFRRCARGKLHQLTVPYPRKFIIEWICEGDDGLLVVSLRRGKRRMFLAINWEDAFFDRNSGAYGPGDLPELDRMQKLAKGWWELRFTNIKAEPGDAVEHWVRVLLSGGQPSPNPRVTYSTALLRRAGIRYRRVARPVHDVFYAFSPIPGVTCTPPWTKLGNGLAALYEILGGPDAHRSKSVAPSKVPADKVVKTASSRAKFGHIGTMGQFSPVALREQIDQVLERHSRFPGTEHYLLTQEERPSEEELGRPLKTAEKEVEYLPECLLRDLLVLARAGLAEIHWEPSPYPFLGHWPTTVKIGNSYLPKEFFRPERMYGADFPKLVQNWYEQICAELRELEDRGVSDDALRLFTFVRDMYGPCGKVNPMTKRDSQTVIEDLDRLLDQMK
jgi:hypothetical protein